MTDAPVRVKVGDKEVIVHTEFQTETSKVPMELRLAEYVGRLIRQYGIPVYVTVIYLGESAGIIDPGGFHYAFDDTFAYSLRYQVIRFPEIDGQDILDKKEPVGLLPFSALMRKPEGTTKKEWLRRCTQTVLSIEMDPVEKQEFVGCFLVLSSHAHEMDLIMSLLKEGIIMIDFEEFPLVKMFTEKARAEARAEAEKELEEAEKELEEAEKELEEAEKARAEGRIKDLTKIIEIQFGKRGVQEVEEHIRAIQDEEKLFTLIEPALTSSSLEDFKRVLVEI